MYNVEVKRLWKGFWQIADPKIWVASTIPMLVGAALSYGITGRFSLPWFLLSLVGIYFIEIGKNSSNEYVDYKTGVDRNIAPENRTPFSGGKKTIVQGKLSLDEVLYIAIGTFLLACGIGLIIVIFREPKILWVGILGVFISIFYSVPPFKFAYTGLGEFAVGLTFGPLVTLGMYMVMSGSFDYRVMIVGLPIGFLISNVLWINQYPDYEADKEGNKKNWVVRMGKEKGIVVYGLLFLLAYLSLIAISILYRNPFWLLGWLSIPLAIKSVRIAREEFNNIPKLVKANANTVIIYQLTGLTLVIASLLAR
ncbi:MAG: prenyltransferase [Clostridiales bacterium]|nr:prenyltransferase [Clostridiales bacterium]